MVKWPLEKRRAGSRVVVKVNRRSVQWWTERTRSSLNALIRNSSRLVKGRVQDACRVLLARKRCAWLAVGWGARIRNLGCQARTFYCRRFGLGPEKHHCKPSIRLL